MPTEKQLDISTLEGWLWDAACVIRGSLDAPKFKDYILPLIFLKRLSDVYDDELDRLGDEFGGRETAEALVEQERGLVRNKERGLVRFYIPEVARWSQIATKTAGLGEYLTDAVRAVSRENPRLQGVIDMVDFNATAAGQPIVDDQRLAALVQILGRYGLGLRDVEPDILGRAYEYLLRKFAEGQGQSAGEFYTPREMGVLMAHILDPEPGMQVYDPCCGSGGLLIKCHLRLLETRGQQRNGHLVLPGECAPLKLHGQEINPSTFAIARMNAAIHDMEAEVRLGDTMHRPAFTRSDGSLRRFDLVTANPMWNQKFSLDTYENDAYERFSLGVPTASSADWGWIQHMSASLNEGGSMAVVLDTGAVSRGSGNQGSNRERDIRKGFVEGNPSQKGDLIETVILLPENLFYNTTAPAIVMIINKAKQHPGEMLLINASKLSSKGRPKNYLEAEHISQVARLYREWVTEEGVSVIVTLSEVARNDYNLSPSRYVASNDHEPPMPLEEAVVLLAQTEEERALADAELDKVLKELGFEDWRSGVN